MGGLDLDELSASLTIPALQGHINAETRTSPAYPAGDTEHTYTVYHDPLPLTVEDLVGETAYTDYSCCRAD